MMKIALSCLAKICLIILTSYISALNMLTCLDNLTIALYVLFLLPTF